MSDETKKTDDEQVALEEREATALALEHADEATVQSFIAENMEMLQGERIQFPLVKMKHGGTQMFQVENIDTGEFENVDGREGLLANIIAVDRFRIYYKTAYDSNEVVPPDCRCLDVTNPKTDKGIGDPGGLCLECPMNEWGSAVNAKGEPTNGKACKEQIRMFLMLDGIDVPYQLVLPPSSLKPFVNYVNKQLVRKRPVQMLWTRFKLALGTNDCSVIDPFRDERDLLKVEFQAAMDIRRTYGTAIAEKDIDQMIRAARASDTRTAVHDDTAPGDTGVPGDTPPVPRNSDVPF